MLWLFLRERTNLFCDRLRVLHFAPEPELQKALRDMNHLQYFSADLRPRDAMLATDIARLAIRSGSFDVVLCTHVFEHVADDRQAMREVWRALSPGGWGILQVPLDSHLECTLEDPKVTAPEERQRLFGQSDHVRLYGRDYRQRLEEAGFDVSVIHYARELTPRTVTACCLLNEDIYFCRKAVSLSSAVNY